MKHGEPTVLVVDDELINLELITEYLTESGMNTITADNGEKAWEMLLSDGNLYSAVLLDRMMPGLDGLEILKRIKSDKDLSMLPVIMQTAKEGRKNLLEGLEAGAYYYLTKPYDRQTLVAIVNTAVSDCRRYRLLQKSVHETAQTLSLLKKGTFKFKSIEDGRSLAVLLANACDDSDRIVLGLTELIVNAVEHGNLGITYEEKSRLSDSRDWCNEIRMRMDMPQYMDRYVTVEFERKENQIEFQIKDNGEGFDWEQYLEISPERVFDSHGRGIAVARSISFDGIEYLGCGNKVRVTVNNQE